MSLQVGKYQLLDRIGSGGMAEIHLARVTGAAGFEKLVVVKRLLPDLAEEKEFVEQFKDEARLAASFSHANIVTTFDFGETDGNYYLAMEYVEGKNLRRIADSLEKRGKRLPEPAAVHIMAEACRGLDYAHARKDATGRVLGIVHRDVSPQNLVVSYSGDVKVLDFGIAKSAAREYHTAAGIVKGKLRYMAPEQVTGDPIDGRADLFAAAVVLWELLYGRRLMPDLPDTELVEWVQKGEFVRPPATSASDEIDQILSRALEVDPNKRFQTCGEFATALARHNITKWPHWTTSELGKLLETEFSDDARREREWIAHILGQMADRVRVEVEVGPIPSSMKVIEGPSRDDIKTKGTPSGGQRVGVPTVLKPMEPDSGNTLSGFHVKASPSNPMAAAPQRTSPSNPMATAPQRTSPSNPMATNPTAVLPPDRGANTEVSIPLVKGEPIESSSAVQLLTQPDAIPDQGTVPIVAEEPKPTPPWMLFGGIGAGLLVAILSMVVIAPMIGGEATPTPTPAITPLAMTSRTPVAGSSPTPIATVSAKPVTATPTTAPATPAPVRTQIAKATPTATKRVIVPTPPPATPVATQKPIANAAYVSVNVSQGWAAVYIDDKLVSEETPLRNYKVTAGKHVITVAKGGRKRSETIQIAAGEQRTVLLDPP